MCVLSLESDLTHNRPRHCHQVTCTDLDSAVHLYMCPALQFPPMRGLMYICRSPATYMYMSKLVCTRVRSGEVFPVHVIKVSRTSICTRVTWCCAVFTDHMLVVHQVHA